MTEEELRREGKSDYESMVILYESCRWMMVADARELRREEGLREMR